MRMSPPEPANGPDFGAGSFVRVPAGEFEMGGSESDKYVSGVELPRQRVTITRSFAMSATPVTEREWSAFAPGDFSVSRASSKPVVGVSFQQAADYARWLSENTPGNRYRLPSEVEWEYACRGGVDSLFPWGNGISVTDANYFYDERGTPVGPGQSTPVKSYPANPFGLFDMLGNVCEWTASPWSARLDGADVDPSRRVIRGGAWDHLPRLLRSSWRDWAPVEARYDNLGFRLIEETDQS